MGGRIILYSVIDEEVRNEHYCDKREREHKLEKWPKVYGMAYEKMYYHIIPEANEDGVSISGLNCRRDFSCKLEW